MSISAFRHIKKHFGLLLLCISTSTVTASPPISRENVKAFFDSDFLIEHQNHGMVGAVVSVVKDGEVLYKGGYGYANLEDRIPADPDDSLFRIASITKPFVWTAIMQLYEQGRLDLDDDVNKHLSTFQLPDTFDEPVRIRHLLTHTPGFEDQAVGMNAESPESTLSVEEYLRTRTPARVYPPGTVASYSNWGTTLAGRIVEEISGQAWDSYVDENILKPLAMNSTNPFSPPADELMSRHAKSYVEISGQYHAMPYESMNDAPAGVMSTTADDMTRFMIAHLGDGDGILSPDTAATMRQPLFVANEALPAMAYGFYHNSRNGQRWYGHGGDTNQFHSQVAMFPAHNLGVFVAYNSDPASWTRDHVIPAFVDYFFPGEFQPRPRETIEVSLEEYEGEYIPLRRSHTKFEKLSILVTSATIAAVESELVVDNQSRWKATGKDVFTGSNFGQSLAFSRGENGEITHVSIVAPLGTYEKVSGLDAPGNQRILIALMLAIALAAAAGYAYKFLFPPTGTPLPANVAVSGWLHAVLIVCLYIVLVMALTGDVNEFVLGVPARFHWMLYAMITNCALGLFVIYSCVILWKDAVSSAAVRLRYSLVALMSVINLWFAQHFNILGYPFHNLPVVY